MSKTHPEKLRCIECGGYHILRTDEYKHYDGKKEYIVNGIPWYKCENCGDILLTLEMCNELDNKRKEK